MPELIDTHSHVSFAAYKDDAHDVIRRALKSGVWMITVGTQSTMNAAAVDLAGQYDEGVYAAVGLHPIHIDADGKDVETAFFDDQELDFKPRRETVDQEQFMQWASNPKTVAIGECGLDYYRIEGEHVDVVKKWQKEQFMLQMEVAAKADLPMIIHCRDAHADMVELLKQGMKQFSQKRKGVIHCFTGTLDEAQQYMDIGWKISFTGIVVFADEVGQVARQIPLENMLVETDAPYLTPPPYRGKRNEPRYVKYIAEHIAKLKGIPVEEVAQTTTASARTLFGI